MKNLKKAAIISAMVLIISIVPAFALNDTNVTNGTQDQNQTKTTNTAGTTQQNCHKNCNGENNGTCDGDQHKYGNKNTNAGANNCGNSEGDQHQYQYGKKNNTGAKNYGKNLNCPKN